MIKGSSAQSKREKGKHAIVEIENDQLAKNDGHITKRAHSD